MSPIRSCIELEGRISADGRGFLKKKTRPAVHL